MRNLSVTLTLSVGSAVVSRPVFPLGCCRAQYGSSGFVLEETRSTDRRRLLSDPIDRVRHHGGSLGRGARAVKQEALSCMIAAVKGTRWS